MSNRFLICLFLFLISFKQFNSNVIHNQLNARIQCEFKDKEFDSLILNCTLVNTPTQDLSSSQTSSSILLNDAQPVSSQSTSLQSLNIRVGLDQYWRTPWESLPINHNIIKTLIWRNSKLTDLGEFAFKDLNSLQKLDLSFNKLSSLSPFSFKYFELDLIELDLSHNLFSQVTHELFQSERLQSLEILRMNENPITILTKKPFDLLKNSLKTIEFNNCKIRSIEPNAFDQMKQLESISLIGNHLRSLNYLTFKDLNLRSFYIHDNPFVCDCHLRWLLDYIKNVDYQQQIYESQLSMMGITTKTNSQQSQQQQISVANAAQQFLKCDQPNSLKSKSQFLDINPDSFMCDIQLEFQNNVNEKSYELGEDAFLTCNVYGDPEPDVYWSYGQKPIGKALNNDDDKYYVNEVRLISSNSRGSFYQSTNKTSELKIKNLQSTDIGVYSCTAEIRGSNNRKQIVFNLKQHKSHAATSLTSAGDLVLSSLNSALNSLSNYLFPNNKQNAQAVSYSTLLLLFSIMVSLIVFLLILVLFLCWKFKCCCCSRRKSRKAAAKMLSAEQEKLLIQNGSSKLHNDTLDHHRSHQNYTNLANDSSATLLSTNKMSNSIRMAYPSSYVQHDIYANHSLLTTTSSTTASYPNQNNHIAIDTSNHTPRYHLLAQQQQQAAHDSYYDDLRYNLNEEAQQAQIYSSPFRQQQQTASYSPIVRRDDPTVPLYATLKPKLLQANQHQRQYNNYAQFSTMHRSTPPLPAPRRNQSNLQLPPPPPPPPILPPVKPKRTFEYVLGNSRDLHSESGAFLLAEENSTPPLEFEQSDYDVNYQTYKRIKRRPTKKPVANGSTTSLDEEDLDLNDLKDFEDVTFDNLRKPGEEQLKHKKQQQTHKQKQLMMIQQLKQQQEHQKQQHLQFKNQKHLLDLGTNSEQSLLLKSSSSSDKSSSNNNLNNNSPNHENQNVDSSSPNTQTTSTTSTNKLDEEILDLDTNVPNINAEEHVQNDKKIYEETEI